MCGIAGILGRERSEEIRCLLAKMGGEIAHRGPDGVGMYVDDGFGMVNTRLSIVDVAGGDQPLCNEDGRYWVMQNGEIYNAPELTAELTERGHRFITRCDTEVLVHAYEEWGLESLHRLNGAFAFALWDRVARRLLLARDRLGIRPLFLATPRGTLLFASEAKALLRHSGMKRSLDPLGIYEILSHWATLPDRSALEGVHELPPGHFLVASEAGSTRTQRWWDLKFPTEGTEERRSEEAWSEDVRLLLEDATQLRLRADVPVGVYLSGGLDSSATAAIVRSRTARRLSAFGVQFTDASFDERKEQDRMAKALNIELSVVEVDTPALADALPEVIRLAEKPMLRTAPAPLLELSGLVRARGLKVVLTGEGADEVFGGYNIFREDKVRRFWAKQPDSVVRPRLLGRLYPYLSRSLAKAGGFTSAFFGRGLTNLDDPLYSHRIRFTNGQRIVRYLSRDWRTAALSAGDPEARLIAALPDGFAAMGPLSRAQYLETRTFLQGYLLHSQGDRMLMGNSVEGRFPFLDHRLVELATQIPPVFRIRGLREKYILRKAVECYLPQDIAWRSKRPYRAPISRALLGAGRPEWVNALTEARALARVGVFEPSAVQKLMAKSSHALERGVGETDEMALIGILSTLLLHNQYVDAPRLSLPVEPTKTVVGRRSREGVVVQ